LPNDATQFHEDTTKHPVLVDIRHDGTVLNHLPSGMTAAELKDYLEDFD